MEIRISWQSYRVEHNSAYCLKLQLMNKTWLMLSNIWGISTKPSKVHEALGTTTTKNCKPPTLLVVTLLSSLFWLSCSFLSTLHPDRFPRQWGSSQHHQCLGAIKPAEIHLLMSQWGLKAKLTPLQVASEKKKQNKAPSLALNSKLY